MSAASCRADGRSRAAPEDAEDRRVAQVSDERASPHDDEEDDTPDGRARRVPERVNRSSAGDL
jgi:hypothetical protein